jgi:hypothetical protein
LTTTGLVGETTPSCTVVLWLVAGPVPVTVIVEVPSGVVGAVLTVSVELLPAVTEAGLKLAVAPAGRPLALRLTVPAEPAVTPVLTV